MPAKKNDFNYLYYTVLEPMEYNYDKDDYSYISSIVMSSKMIHDNRKKATTYIENGERSFYDIHLNKYEPTVK